MAAFHLFLKGPALIWFNSLSVRDSWATVRAAFILEYCNILSSPSLIAESVAFDNLRLSQSQAIEDFHASVMDKGRKLRKSEADMLNKFISGLPSQLMFFVRADRVESLRDALQSAKIGEAHGYRVQSSADTVQLSGSSTPKPSAAAAGSFQAQLDMINKKLEELSTQSRGQPTKSRLAPRVCFRCKGEKHIKTQCNWNGQGEPTPLIQCQLCFQMGHSAPRCKKLSSNIAASSTCTTAVTYQLCNQQDHVAKDCPTLNRQGLGVERTSQA